MMKYYMYLMFSMGLLNYCWTYMYMYVLMLMVIMLVKMDMIFNLWVEIYLIFSMDFYSFYLVILSLWLCGIMLIIKMKKNSVILIMMMLLILFFSFSTFDLFMFYFMFEASLIPIFLLIKMDGYMFERFEAAMYMFFFTMITSMPFMVIMINLMGDYCSLFYYILELEMLELSHMEFMFLILVFLVKLPMFFVHIWLPKAHVEAPVYGSMVLAGVLLKLGSYGILRMGQLFYLMMKEWSVYLIVINLMGGVILSVVCLFMVDLKMLVAYSSVVHMSLVISSLFTLSKMGFNGAYLMMIGHGLCSSGLFYIVNINYERLGSRMLLINKGMINMDSSLTMWWFLLCIGNFSAPITLNLMGEIMMLISLISYDFFLMFFLMFMCFLSAAYSLYLFSFTQHGSINIMYFQFIKVKMKEYLILILHILPLNCMIFMLNMFMN